MKEAIKQLICKPTRYARAADGSHLLGRICSSIFVDGWGEPGRNGAPLAANVEGEVIDRAIETREAADVFVIVERGAGLGKTLMGKCVLELLDLGFFVEIVFLYFTIFFLCSECQKMWMFSEEYW